ncbi:MAG: hypothetical protein QF422_00420 [Dehalococcoidia bacterium]|nr:hypothetical protein [Dehalococcoidia bacterium]
MKTATLWRPEWRPTWETFSQQHVYGSSVVIPLQSHYATGVV